MSEKFKTGAIVEGKVTSIKPFGAFVALDENKQGLVHISQVSHEFVKDIHDVLSEGDEVRVKILSIDEETGKISLSIKETQPMSEISPKRSRRPKKRKKNTASATYQDPQVGQGFNTLKDQLKAWVNQANANE